MEKTSLARLTRSFTVVPRGTGRGRSAEVRDGAGRLLATCDATGTLRDDSGVVLKAALSWHGRGARATDACLEITDGTELLLGTAQVVGYGFGPVGRRISVDVVDALGRHQARLEPTDRRGLQLVVRADGADVATVSGSVVRSGLLRRSRVYSVRTADTMCAALRPLVLAMVVRYEALLDAAQAVEQPD